MVMIATIVNRSNRATKALRYNGSDVMSNLHIKVLMTTALKGDPINRIRATTELMALKEQITTKSRHYNRMCLIRDSEPESIKAIESSNQIEGTYVGIIALSDMVMTAIDRSSTKSEMIDMKPGSHIAYISNSYAISFQPKTVYDDICYMMFISSNDTLSPNESAPQWLDVGVRDIRDKSSNIITSITKNVSLFKNCISEQLATKLRSDHKEACDIVQNPDGIDGSDGFPILRHFEPIKLEKRTKADEELLTTVNTLIARYYPDYPESNYTAIGHDLDWRDMPTKYTISYANTSANDEVIKLTLRTPSRAQPSTYPASISRKDTLTIPPYSILMIDQTDDLEVSRELPKIGRPTMHVLGSTTAIGSIKDNTLEINSEPIKSPTPKQSSYMTRLRASAQGSKRVKYPEELRYVSEDIDYWALLPKQQKTVEKPSTPSAPKVSTKVNPKKDKSVNRSAPKVSKPSRK